ncbi:hypothetical protein KXX11_003880, partial [Aspergillus fumigatus]
TTGYQWKWGYDYLNGEGEGLAFISTLDSSQRAMSDAGAKGAMPDDYLLKPFEFRELLARMRAIVRRRDGADSLHPERHELVVQANAVGGYTNTVTLTPLAGVTNLGSTTATAPGTATVQVTPSLTKAVASSTIAGGGTTTFTIVIGNARPSTLTTASIVDTLPSNLTATQ